MCEQSEVPYKHDDVVWVKLGTCWWPGEVKDVEKLPEEVAEEVTGRRKQPLAVVKFFTEDK